MAEEKGATEEDFKAKLALVKNNDSSLLVLNLNNLEGSKPEWGIELIDALCKNTHVQSVLLANCSISTEGGKRVANLLKTNATITELNLETNKIGADGIKAIAEALEANKTLKEIKLTNQSQNPGNEAERVLAKAVDSNTILQKCTITLNDTSSRNILDRAITRNREIARKARVAAKKN